jgi:hypothetical protein
MCTVKLPASIDRYVQHVPTAALPWLVMLGLVAALILVAVGGDIVLAVLGMLVWWVAAPLALAFYLRTRKARRRELGPAEEP